MLWLREYAIPLAVTLMLHLALLLWLASDFAMKPRKFEIKEPKFIQAQLVKLKPQSVPKPPQVQPLPPPEPAPAPEPEPEKPKSEPDLKKEKPLEEVKPKVEPKPVEQAKPKVEPKPKAVKPDPKIAAREKAEQEKKLKQKKEKERQEKEQLEKKKKEKQRLEKERLEKERLEKQRAKQQQRRTDELLNNLDDVIEDARADEVTAQSYIAFIQRAVQSNWSRPASARNGMQVLLNIQLIPSGDVVSVTVAKSSGNDAFDRSAVAAVKKAENFPELAELELRIFEKYYRHFTLLFKPEDLRL